MNEALPLLLCLGIPAAFGLLALLGYGLFRWRQEAMEAELKHVLLQRGMSPDDIVRVLKASKASLAYDAELRQRELDNEKKLRQVELKLRHELKVEELALKRQLAEHGMSAEDILRVLQASRTGEASEGPPARREPVEDVGRGGIFIKE